jgi:VanZ family protein
MLSSGGAGATAPKAALAWVAVAIWTAVIGTSSGAEFSESSTSRFVGPLLRWLLPDIDQQTLEAAHFFVRKSAHAAEYGVLALLSSRALRLSLSVSPASIAGIALGLVLAVACADETRQAFTPPRTGSPWDVGLDLAGGAAALGLLEVIRRLLPSGAGAAALGTGR